MLKWRMEYMEHPPPPGNSEALEVGQAEHREESARTNAILKGQALGGWTL